MSSEREQPPLGLLKAGCVAGVLGAFVVALVDRDWADMHQWIVEPLLGMGVACGLVVLTMHARRGLRTPTLRLLESRPLVTLGLFSYSVYLVHSPLIGWFNLATDQIVMPTLARLALMLGVALPLSVLIAYLFFLAVERRFMSGHMADATDSGAIVFLRSGESRK